MKIKIEAATRLTAAAKKVKPAKVKSLPDVDFDFYAQEEEFFGVFDAVRGKAKVPKSITPSFLSKLTPLICINVAGDGTFEVYESEGAFYLLAKDVGGEDDYVEMLKVKDLPALKAIISKANKAADKASEDED